jgi:hypothetical protein
MDEEEEEAGTAPATALSGVGVAAGGFSDTGRDMVLAGLARCSGRAILSVCHDLVLITGRHANAKVRYTVV